MRIFSAYATGKIQYPIRRKHMAAKPDDDRQSGVEKGLVSMFLKLSPEERLCANDNALRTIIELRHGYRKRTPHGRKSELDS